MPILAENAPAKVNLTLRILERRADGYHELESLVTFADIGDRVWLDTDAPTGCTSTGVFANAIDGINLIDRALLILATTEPRLKLGGVRLDKVLPVAAGLGGGSSDAAAVLRAVRRANPALACSIDWTGLALQLGADVPVCLSGRSAMMRGIGERLEPVGLPPLCAVLVTPDSIVPANKTRRIFEAFSGYETPPGLVGATSSPGFESRARLLDHMRNVGNDLAEAAAGVMPEIRAVSTVLASLDACELIQLSGAGPTVFGVFPDRAAARKAAGMLARTHPGWWVRAVTLQSPAALPDLSDDKSSPT